MYLVVLMGLIAAGIALAVSGVRTGSRPRLGGGIALTCATVLFFGLLSFWGEMLWFDAVGFSRPFWTRVLAQVGIAAAGGVASAALTLLLTLPTRRRVSQHARWAGAAVGGFAGVLWGAATWSVVLKWALGVTTGTSDPVFGKDMGFYLFTLPFLDAVYSLLFFPTVIAIAVAGWSFLFRALSRDVPEGVIVGAAPEESALHDRGLLVALGALAIVLAVGRLLAPYHMMYSTLGVVYGPGWSDVHVRVPVYYVTAAALVIVGALLIIPRAMSSFEARLAKRFGASIGAIASIGAPAGAVALIWVVGLAAVPTLTQWLVVQPNELTLEQPYLRNNIRFTREGFGLGDVDVREFPVEGDLTADVARQNEGLLSEVRVWDPHALDDVLEQFQELRLYYEVTGVDFDRYHLDGRYRQVLIAPREMEAGNLPSESQTFVNRHFKYTHGYGLVMAPVSDFTATGLPNLVIRDLPPVADYGSVRVQRPEIYYGELTNDYVIANSRAAEFDYPAGGLNVYVHYAGRGGVRLDNLWRKIVYGWKLGGTRLLFSDYPTEESRVMFHRNIVDRVSTIAPFLTLDEDPYSVVVDGKVSWIIDAYTTSSYFPYSEPYVGGPSVAANRAAAQAGKAQGSGSDAVGEHRRLDGVNYVRNSVKAVVDAYDGSVTLYVFDPSDPIIRVWSRIYPDMFRPMEAMPAGLRAHVRYPETLLHTQGVVFAKYHMTDPTVFYNREDLWVRATEKYYDEIHPVEPYYVMWKAPGSSEIEFILMQPFTPKNRQVLIGWLAGMCDGDSYGKMVAYRFPKDKWILGPQQVDTKIDQAPELSAQLTLWDQHGKRVIRGNVLAIPIAKTILYVEPIYLQAQTAAYPELRMVVLMHGDDMSYGPTFQAALDGLVNGAALETGGAARPRAPSAAAEEANRVFEEYLRLTKAGEFAEAGKQLELLQQALQRWKDQSALPAR